ncbi:alpha/beta hydrolase [Mycolicibacterium sp. CBM1]
MTTTPDTVAPATVTFDSDGLTLEALYYRPKGDGPFPCVVMAGGWCYVKELAQPTYAAALADQGIAALIFDYRNMGGSQGEPRQHIDPAQQIADYRNAIDWIESKPEIDGDRIGAWGISYSGGHVLILGAVDSRVKALCGIVPVTDGYQNMRLAHGTLGFRRFNEAILAARRLRRETGEITYFQHQPAVEGEISTWPFPKSKKTFAALKEREAPAYVGEATAESADLLMGYSVFPYLPRLLGKPSLLIVAEGDDHTHWDLALRAYEEIPGDAKELMIVSNADHLTLYADRDRQNVVAKRVADFFSSHL